MDNFNEGGYSPYSQPLLIFVYPNYHNFDEFNLYNELEYHRVKLHNDTSHSKPNERAIDGYYDYPFVYFPYSKIT